MLVVQLTLSLGRTVGIVVAFPRVPFEMIMRHAFVIPVFIWFCMSVSGSAQQNSPAAAANNATAIPPSANRRIELDVVVSDKSGKAIAGLQQQDFTLLDDKQPQSILSFHAEPITAADPPQQAIVVVDAINTGYQSVVFERQQLDKFLQQNDGQLPIPMSLVLLTDTSSQIQAKPIRDGNALAKSLDDSPTSLRSIGRSQGFYGGAERTQISITDLQRLAAYENTQPGRKLLIWLSPGWPLLSGPEVELGKKAQAALFNLIVGLSAALREARVTLYSVDPLGLADAATGRTIYYQSFVKGVKSANKVENGDLGLEVFATQTGGQVLNSSNDVAGLIAHCLEDTKAFYTISFDSPPSDGPNEYHSLQIKIDKPGLTARTRTGYYDQP